MKREGGTHHEWMDTSQLALLDAHVQEEKRQRHKREREAEREARVRRAYRTAVMRGMLDGEAPVRFPAPEQSCCWGNTCSGLLADRSTRLAVIICHPWGPMGGTMHDFCVTTLLTLFADAGLTTLRFNFRYGLGRGHSSASDLRAACDMLRSLQAPPDKLLLVGYSYGSLVVADVAPGRPDVAAFALISPPLGAASALFFGRNVTERAQASHKPKLAIIGSHDQFCSQRRFDQFARGLQEPSVCMCVCVHVCVYVYVCMYA